MRGLAGIRRARTKRYKLFRQQIYGNIKPEDMNQAKLMDVYIWRMILTEDLLDTAYMCPDIKDQKDLRMKAAEMLQETEQRLFDLGVSGVFAPTNGAEHRPPTEDGQPDRMAALRKSTAKNAPKPEDAPVQDMTEVQRPLSDAQRRLIEKKQEGPAA